MTAVCATHQNTHHLISIFQIVSRLPKSGGAGNPSEHSKSEAMAKTKNTNINCRPSENDQHCGK